MKIQAILFDFDGTLADTMQRHFFCWKQTLEEVGVVINEGDYYPMEGSSLHKIAEKYTGSQEQQFINKLVVRKKKLYVDLYKHETLAFYPGSVKLIQFLTKKYPLAIVTAGHEDQLRKTAPKEFLNLFANFKPSDLELSEIIKFILIGDFFDNENLIRFLRLLPFPEIKTAVLIFF